jgi:hypothetical protein
MALPSLTLRIQRFLLVGVCAFVLQAPNRTEAQTLEHLEAILTRYETMESFLSDSSAVIEYREALKLFMDEESSFDPIYEEFIRQIRDVGAQVPGFSEQAWERDPTWKQSAFTISAQIPGTGLELKREAFFETIEALKTSLGGSVFTPSEIERYVSQLRAAYRILPGEAVNALSRAQSRAYRAQLGGDKKNGIPPLRKHPAAIALSQHLIATLLEKSEVINDALNSGDADIAVATLKELQSPRLFVAEILKHEKGISESVLDYLSFDHPIADGIFARYEKGISSMNAVRAMSYPRLSPELLEKLVQLEERRVRLQDYPRHLTPAENEELTEWKTKTPQVTEAKLAHAKAQKEENPFFFYTLKEDPARGTVALNADANAELRFRRSPRPFHAFFAGRRTKECVGGLNCKHLTPKRWARAALKHAESIFNEKFDGRMLGMVGITPLIHTSKRGQNRRYGAVELMSHGLRGSIVVQDPVSGRKVKYSVLDEFLRLYRPKSEFAGLMVSDGNEIKANASAFETVTATAAFAENDALGRPSDFSLEDPIAAEIARLFPKAYQGYGKGSMIHEGMRGDGKKIYRLVPAEERRKWTKAELELEIASKIVSGEAVKDSDIIWKRARENNVILDSLSHYRTRRNELEESLWNAFRLGNESPNVLRGILELTRSATLSETHLKFLDEKAPRLAKQMAKPSGSLASDYAGQILLSRFEKQPSALSVQEYLLTAVERTLKGRYPDHGIALYRKLLENYPGDSRLVRPSLLQALAAVSMQRHSYFVSEEALRTWIHALKSRPKNRSLAGPWLRKWLIRDLERFGGHAELLKGLEWALFYHPNNHALADPTLARLLVKVLNKDFSFRESGTALGETAARLLKEFARRRPNVVRKALNDAIASFNKETPLNAHAPYVETLASIASEVWRADPNNPTWQAQLTKLFLGRRNSIKFASMALSQALADNQLASIALTKTSKEQKSPRLFLTTSILKGMERALEEQPNSYHTKYFSFPLIAALRLDPLNPDLHPVLQKYFARALQDSDYEDIRYLAVRVFDAFISSAVSNPAHRQFSDPGTIDAIMTFCAEHTKRGGFSDLTPKVRSLSALHPAEWLLSSNKAVRGYMEKQPRMQEAVVDALFSEKSDRSDQLRVMRSFSTLPSAIQSRIQETLVRLGKIPEGANTTSDAAPLTESSATPSFDTSGCREHYRSLYSTFVQRGD